MRIRAQRTGDISIPETRNAIGTSGYRVRMTTMIQQKRLEQTTTDLPPSARFPLNSGRSFDVIRKRNSIAVRLECSMSDGDQRIFPIAGDAELSPNIRFVSKNSSSLHSTF
jgi:hypothetical protein